MTFAELTWNPDNWNEEIGQNMGFQAQYEADNGYLLVVDTQLSEEQAAPDGTPLPSATEAGQGSEPADTTAAATEPGTSVAHSIDSRQTW